MVLNGAGFVGFGLLGLIIAGFTSFSYGVNQINIAINNIIVNANELNARCYLCSQGMMLLRGKRVQAVRWDQVKMIQRITFANSNLTQQYVLYPLNDGEPLVLRGLYVRVKAFRTRCEQEIARHLSPKCTAAYHAGQVVNFGAINVTSQGLSKGENGEKVLPWAMVGSVEERRGVLIIKEKGSLTNWARIDASTMINLCIFLPLIQQIKRNNLSTEIALASLSKPSSVIPSSPQSEWQEYE